MIKVRRFTIIELIVAMSLACIVSGLLFLTIRNLAFVYTRFTKYVPTIIQQEKAFHFIKNLTDRIYIDSNHPVEMTNDSVSFFYYPTVIDYDETIECYHAKIETKNSSLIATISEKKDSTLKPIAKQILLTQITNFHLAEEKNPKCIVLSFQREKRNFSWVFFLELQSQFKEE